MQKLEYDQLFCREFFCLELHPILLLDIPSYLVQNGVDSASTPYVTVGVDYNGASRRAMVVLDFRRFSAFVHRKKAVPFPSLESIRP